MQQSPYTQWNWQPSPPPKKSLPTWLIVLAAIGAISIVTLVVMLLLPVFNQLAAQVQTLENTPTPELQSCTIGVVGAAATITIIGTSAYKDCADAVAGDLGLICGTQNCPANQWYLYTGTPNTPEVCEGDYLGRHLIVRDQGALDIYGNAICKVILQGSS